MQRASIVTLLALAALVPSRVIAVDCAPFEFQGRHATVCRTDVRADRLQLHLNDDHGKPLNTFSALERHLAARGERLLFAMNAGMYHASFAPVGLFVSNGTESNPLNLSRGQGNFFLKPNGVLAITASEAHIVDSATYRTRKDQPLIATQSGPLLLDGGRIHPALAPHSASRLARNGVGTIGDHQVVFAITEEPFNLYEFAVLFRDGLHCTDALYLDGTVSSLFSAELSRNDARSPLGPMIAVAAPATP